MRRPSDQVLRGLQLLADHFDAALQKPPLEDIPALAKRDIRAAIRWAWRMNEVRGLRAEIRARRAALPDGSPWDPQLALVPYAPARRKKS